MLYFQINNQPEKAIALLKMQLEMNPGDQNILNTLTHYLFLTEQYEELLIARKKLVALDDKPYKQINLVEALMLNGRIEETQELLIKSLEQFPNLPDLLAALTSIYALTGQVDKANSLLQKLVVINPDFEELAIEHSKAFKYAKQHPQAAESLIKYKGHYRLQQTTAEYDIRIIEDLL
ncbi:MAG: tetratricopeptide (TPR) repeat protein [Saprospiraceae bacterium]|jgi:tetratricopeptide (TPR) repeat protein